jgi:hypothetical protein
VQSYANFVPNLSIFIKIEELAGKIESWQSGLDS